MNGGVIDRLKDNIWRNIDLYCAVNMDSNILQARNVVNACFLEILGDVHEDLLEIGRFYLIEKVYIFIGILNKISKVILNYFVIKWIIAAMFAPLIYLSWAASHNFTQTNNVWMGQLNHLFQFLSCEVKIDDGFEHRGFWDLVIREWILLKPKNHDSFLVNLFRWIIHTLPTRRCF